MLGVRRGKRSQTCAGVADGQMCAQVADSQTCTCMENSHRRSQAWWAVTDVHTRETTTR